MGDQERLPKVYETLHLSPSICIYSYNIYFNLNLVSLLCRKTFLEMKSKSWIFIFFNIYNLKMAGISRRPTKLMAENGMSRIEMISAKSLLAKEDRWTTTFSKCPPEQMATTGANSLSPNRTGAICSKRPTAILRYC